MKTLKCKIVAVVLLISILVGVLSSCSASMEDLIDKTGQWSDDKQDSLWGDGADDVWDNTTDIEYYVNSVLLFEPWVTDEFSEIEVLKLEYDDDAEYFDDEAVKLHLGSRFNINDLAKKYAIGSGVIIVCVLINVITYGSATPFACFIATRAAGALEMAATGMATEAAMRAITTAIKTGSAEETVYQFIEGAVDGYLWGAIFGAVTGGMADSYCFAENTLVKTESGYKKIQDIGVGELVWSRNLETGENELQPVTKIYTNVTNEWVKFQTANDEIVCTPGHQFYDGEQYRAINSYAESETIETFSESDSILWIESQLCDNEATYNLEVANNHNYFVGFDELLSHNKNCRNSEYAGKVYKFENTYKAYQKTGDVKYLDIYNELLSKYPNGVPFSDLDKYGRTWAIFDDYIPIGKNNKMLRKMYAEVTEENYKLGKCLKGVSDGTASSNPDFKRFWKDMVDEGYIDSKDLAWYQQNYVVHHEGDMRTLSAVPKDLHNVGYGEYGVAHTGGGSYIREFLESIGLNPSSFSSALK